MEAILNNLIKATGWSIFHSLWQGAIIYGVLLLITIAIPRLKPRLKHNLAFGATCLIFICYCITFFSAFKLPVSLVHQYRENISLIAEYNQHTSSIPQKLSSKTEQLFPYLVGIYGIGLAFQLLTLCMGYRRMLVLKKSQHFAVPAEWKLTFEKLVIQLNLRRHIGFHLSDKINVPLVIGYFKPIVLFPIGLATQLDMDQVEAILIHELSHVRRNDYLLNLIKTGIETLLFFNPFIWLSGKFINIEREHACDDLVLKFTGNPMTYAHALLKLEILKDKSTPVFSMAATGKNQHLYQRIKRITDMKTNYMNVRQQMFTIALAIVTVISLAWVKPSKAEKTTKVLIQQNRIEIIDSGIKSAPKPPQAPKAKKPTDIPPAPAIECSVPAPQVPGVPNPHSKTIPVAPAPPIPAKHIDQDTTKKKVKYSIVTIDEKGNRTTYKSLKEMPEHMRNEVINETFDHNMNLNMDIRNGINIQIDSLVTSSALLESPEWKQSVADLHASVDHIKSYFRSSEWNKQQEEILKKAKKIQKQAKEISKQAISDSKDSMRLLDKIRKEEEGRN